MKSLLAAWREAVTATGSLPASAEAHGEKGIAFGRLVGELTELISVLQLASLFHNIGRYLEKTAVWEFLRLRKSPDWNLVALWCAHVHRSHQVVPLRNG